MQFSELTDVFLGLEETTKRLEMTRIVAEFFKKAPYDVLPTVCLFMRGRVFPMWSNEELGIAEKIMIKCISTVSGATEAKVEKAIKETGDPGLAAEKILTERAQTTLFAEELTVEKVHRNLRKLSVFMGKGSQDKKISYITELLSQARPKDARYIVRLVLGELRLGVGDGIIRDAIAAAFSVDAAIIENAVNMTSDIGEVAMKAKAGGATELERIMLTPGKPIKVMLAQKKGSIAEAVETLGECAFEIKYDGARIQVHKDGADIRLYTRRLENVTKQFPEVVKNAAERIKANKAIVEGEVVAIRMLGDRRPRPFQDLSRRIKRKYDIPDMVHQIPVELNLFDIIYLDGRVLINTPFKERRALLRKTINESPLFRLADELVTKNPKKAEEFYKQALSMGHEGVMAKNLDAPYKPGSRVGYMYKIKPVMESLDLVVVGATWGEGRRASWLGSYLLAAYDSSTGDYKTVGRMATGLTDAQLEELTQTLKPYILREKGKELEIKPALVFEVAYEEIQKSPTYESGFALRFPRLVRVREDKGPEEADNLERLEQLSAGQKT